MKILHLISDLSPRSGGPSKACFEMARAVAKKGEEVWICTTDKDIDTKAFNNQDNQEIKDGVKILYFPYQFPRFWAFSLPMLLYLYRNLPKFDVVHIHSMYLFHCFVGGFLCRLYKKPYIVRPHGILDPYIFKRHRFRKYIMEILFERRNLYNASVVHFVSQEEQTLAETVMPGLKGRVIPLGLDIDEYSNLPEKGKFKNKYQLSMDSRIVLFLGRVNHKKGLDLLVPAFSELSKKYSDLFLVIAGPDDESTGNKIRKLIYKYKIQKRVMFVGNLLGVDKLSAFVDASVFVLPSYSENFGIAVIEAMACGTPVVISDKVNIYHEIKNNSAGEVTSLNIPELILSIKKILDNNQYASELSVNGRKLVELKFNWNSISDALMNLYRLVYAKA